MTIKHACFGALAFGAAIGLIPAAAGAAEKPTVTLSCPAYLDPGQIIEVKGITEQVVVNGNGDFTPAHSVTTTRVYIPVAFGDSTATVRNPAGTITEVLPGDEPIVKGKNGTAVQNTRSCTYTTPAFLSDGTDPEGPPAGYTVTYSGQVTVFTAAKGR